MYSYAFRLERVEDLLISLLFFASPLNFESEGKIQESEIEESESRLDA